MLSVWKWTVCTPWLKTLIVRSVTEFYTRCRGEGILEVIWEKWTEEVMQSWYLDIERKSPAGLFGFMESTLSKCSWSSVVSMLPLLAWHILTPLKVWPSSLYPVKTYLTKSFSLSTTELIVDLLKAGHQSPIRLFL